jgi:hypothetical protein
MIKPCLIMSLPILLALSAVGQAQAFSNDCSLQFAGSFCKAVKNRPAAAGATYTVHNDGQPRPEGEVAAKNQCVTASCCRIHNR